MVFYPAIRLAANSAKSAVGYIYLQCHIRPGASKQREGVVSVSDTVIEVCVSGQPKDGEANLNVRKVFSDVYSSTNFARPGADFSRFSSAESPTLKLYGV
jgi:hypothetical protein